MRPDTWTRRALLPLTCLLLGLAGCMPAGPAGDSGTLTEHIPPSAFVAVVPAAADGPALSRLIAATAQPLESVDILEAGAAKVLVASAAPPPATVGTPRKPTAPSAGATSYQKASYDKRLQGWQAEIATDEQAVSARTGSTLSAWVTALGIQQKMNEIPAGANPGSLADECAVAASALAGLGQAAGDTYGSRRVILVYAANLGGDLVAGELTGDDVIVITSFLPSAAAASAAQVALLNAGAAQARVLGPEAIPSQLAQLVTAGLSHNVFAESLSGPALFANNSAALLPAAVRLLTPLIGPLREPGSTAVINGYASTPGSTRQNYLLSYARAAAVADFLEVHGVPAASLTVVGHGDSDLVAPGPSAANRRVIVVIDEPAR